VPTHSVFTHEDACPCHFAGNVYMGSARGDERGYCGSVFRVALADDAVKYASGRSAHDFPLLSGVKVPSGFCFLRDG
jgi:hypothetical protein